MRIYENECGFFYADKDGKLLRYAGKRLHLWRKGPHPHVNELTIPEGIRELPEGAFRGYEIRRLVLPSSLEKLGKGVFSGSHVAELHLADQEHTSPELLKQLVHRLQFAFSWDWYELVRKFGRKYMAIPVNENGIGYDWRVLRSTSGTFWVDPDGMLMIYYLAGQRDMQEDEPIDRLCIPEGVEGLPSGSFEGIRVTRELVLPRSLRYVGRNVFSRCVLPDVALPENLEVLDCYAFAQSTIRSVTLRPDFGKKLLPIAARQFKDCTVEEYRIPAASRALLKSRIPEYGFENYEEEDPELGTLFCVRDTKKIMGWGNDTIELILGYVRGKN